MAASDTPESKLRLLRMFWAALVPVPLLLLAAAFIAKPPKDQPHVPLPVLAAVAAAIFALSLFAPARAVKARLARFPIAPTATPQERTLAAYRLAGTAFQAGMGPAIAVSAVGLAALLLESAGWLAAPFFVASYVALGLQFPTHAKTLAWLDETRR